MKKHLRWLMAVALGLGISLTGVSTAFAADLTWTADQTIDLSAPDINLTILTGSKATSLVVNTGDIQIVVANADPFTVTSADSALSVTGNVSYGLNNDCTGGLATVTVTGGSGGEILTITPTGSICASGSSGGGGGSTPPPVTPPGVTPPGITPPGLIFPPVAGAHGPGSVVKTSEGTVWFITNDNQRRPFTSAGAFLSYGFLSFAQVVDANAGDLVLAVGSFVPPMDGKVICSDRDDSYAKKGTCYLITGSMRAAFTSGAVFTGLGFKFSHITKGDVSFMASDSNINNTTSAHRRGVLVNNHGTIQLVGSGSLMGLPSMAVLSSWGYSLADVVPSNAADRALSQSGVMPARVVGQLSPQ